MSRTRRILLEILGPPFLATLILAITKLSIDGVIASIFGFPVVLMFAYVYAMAPSAVFAGVLEFWFQKEFNLRYGLLGTGALSALLGFGGGFIVQLEVQGTMWSSLPVIGALSGLTIGCYLERRCRVMSRRETPRAGSC